MQPLAESWKIFLSVTQVLGKHAGAAGSEMRLQLEALTGYQSPIQGLFMEAVPSRSSVWLADHPGHVIAKCLCADAVLIMCKYKASLLIALGQKRTTALACPEMWVSKEGREELGKNESLAFT